MIYGITYDSDYGRMRAMQAISAIVDELKRAESIHIGWPEDKIHMAGILCEEAGEAMQAAIDDTYGGEHAGEMQKELIQAGAMALRSLMHLEEK